MLKKVRKRNKNRLIVKIARKTCLYKILLKIARYYSTLILFAVNVNII
jgi:hypothetical protein